jgi:hypothetical protein
MSRTLLPLVQHFLTLIGRERVRGIVADQEMRSVALFLALEALGLGFVTIGRTPTPQQEAAFEVAGLFLPYRRDPQSGELTHWVAHAHTLLRDRATGLSFQAEVTLVVDCRAGLPGRLIPILHNWRDQEVPVELPHGVYVGRWAGQERVFRDMHPCQNLDAHYGQKKVAVPNRTQARQREALQRQVQAQEKRVATAQRQVQEYAARRAALEQEAQQKHRESQAQMAALRQASREAATAQEREQCLIQTERLAARDQVQQVRFQGRQHRLAMQQRTWQQKLEERQGQREAVVQALQELEERPFYDFDLEKDNLMTYLRLAGENAHRFVQEQYFAGTLLEKVDEVSMVRVVYNQPGWVQRRGKHLRLLLQGYGDAKVQAAVAQACQRVNQAQLELPSGLRLHMEVAAKILDC